MQLPILTVKPIKVEKVDEPTIPEITETVYFSMDIEADGPIPGEYSMLSFGCVAFNDKFEELGFIESNLELLSGAKQDPDTMEFWKRNEAAYQLTRIGTRRPEEAMKLLNDFVESLCNRPTFIGYPAAYDWSWVHWYSHKFIGKSPFRHSSVLDIKTLGWSKSKVKDFSKFGKRSFPKRWFNDINQSHNHVGIDDAREQGIIFKNIMKEI